MHRETAHRGRAVLTEFGNLRYFFYPPRQQEAESSQSASGRWGQTPSYEVWFHYLFAPPPYGSDNRHITKPVICLSYISSGLYTNFIFILDNKP